MYVQSVIQGLRTGSVGVSYGDLNWPQVSYLFELDNIFKLYCHNCLVKHEGWINTSPVRRWMISKECLKMRTVISVLPLLPPCIMELVGCSTMGQ